MKWQTRVLLILSTMACEKKGEGEKIGKKVDNAFNSVKDKIHEATQ